MNLPKISFLAILLLLTNLLAAQKIGNNFFISGSDGSGGTTSIVQFPAIAYNTLEDEYLVVWAGKYSGVSGLHPEEPEIWGQLMDAAADTLIGSNFRISNLGPSNNPTYGTNAPKVVYNPTYNEYLVVFYGDDNTPPIVNGESEIYGQRLDADGNEIGVNDFRISIMGDENETSKAVRKKFDGYFPDVVYNDTNDEYMVVWYGDNVESDLEIWAQRLQGIDCAEIGGDFRVSFVNTNDPAHINDDPTISWNSQNNEYLVTWHGGNFNNKTYQIHGQLMDSTGFIIDTTFQVSNSVEDRAREAYNTYNKDHNQYLVIWGDESDTNQFRIKGHLLDSAGVKIDTTISISQNGENEIRYLDTQVAEVKYDSIGKEYIVIWSGNVANDPMNAEYKVHFIALDDTTGQVIDTAFVLSNSSGDVENNPSPALGYRPLTREFLAVWSANNPIEISGQRFETLNNQCNDDIQNGDETDIDCGGTVCMACPTCDDGIQNGDETDIDCGGIDCPACPTCDDGIQNGDETDVDCGGADCPACPTCDDGIQNGDETDVDCGGADCPACPTCDDGIQNGDETGVDCGGSCPNTCPPTCDDSIQNGDETGIDCGGSCPNACPTCTDGIQNGNETDIDCGGIDCPACPTCDDGIQNGDETDVDCGGADCPACPTCDDGIQNGDETGIDCGGSCPNMCCTIGELCDDGDSNTINDTLNMDCICMGVSIAKLSAKIFLEGVFQDTIMLDSLRAKGKISVQSPYADALMVSDSALVFAMKTDSSIVDWVEIELRTTTNGASVAKRSALVRRDGRIVDESGNMPVRFPNLEAGDYYVIIRHRNHIEVMTNEKVRLE